MKRGPVIDTVFVSEQRHLVIERQHGGQLELTLKWRCAAAAIAKKRVAQVRAAALIRGSLVLTEWDCYLRLAQMELQGLSHHPVCAESFAKE